MTNLFQPHCQAEEILVAAGAVRQCVMPASEEHFELSSGLHTRLYIDCSQLYRDRELSRQMARLLLARLPECVRRVECIAVPSERARPMAELLAESLCDGKVVALPASRSNDVNSLSLRGRCRDVVHRARTLLFDDVILSGGTLTHLSKLVRSEGGYVLPTVVTIVDRRGPQGIAALPVHSLVQRVSTAWNPSDCPLCKAGSHAVPGHE